MKAAWLALSYLLGAGPAAAADPARYIKADLIVESMTPRPGATMLVGIRMAPRPGWHGYWSNPGQSGFAPTVRWTMPPSVTMGPLRHPAPSLLTVAGASSFVHEGPHVLLSRLTLARGIAPGTSIPLAATVNWAACTATQCVPLSTTLTVDLVAGNGERNVNAPVLNAAAGKIPRTVRGGNWTRREGGLRLHLPATPRLDPRTTRFFPDDNGMFDTARARATQAGGAVEISAPVARAPPATISGVATDGASAFRLMLVEGAAPAPAEAKPSAAPELIVEGPPKPGASTVPAATKVQPQASRPRPSLPWLWIFGAAVLCAAGVLGYRSSKRG